MDGQKSQLITKIISKGETNLEEIVAITDMVLATVKETDKEAKSVVYNSLTAIDGATIIPAVFSAKLADDDIKEDIEVCSKYFEVALSLAQRVMARQVPQQDGTVQTQLTGKKAVVMATNLEPSLFPTVDLSLLASSILQYNVDYKRAELQNVVKMGYCLTNIKENKVEFLLPLL